MTLHPLVVQFGGSLLAILALAALARWMGLGGNPRLRSDADVERVAAEVVDGFLCAAMARDTEGKAALARDLAGQILLIKLHGNRFAGRILMPGSRAQVGPAGLAVDCREARFGKVVLAIDDARTWAEAINALDDGRHA